MSDTSYDQQKLRELASAVMDETASEEDRSELTEMLRESPAARDEYLALVDLHAMLATELVTTPSPQAEPQSNRPRPKQTPPKLPRRRWTQVAGLVALAAGLLIAVTLLPRKDDVQPPINPRDVATESQHDFVTVAHITNAVWASDQVDVGSRLGVTKMRLTSGFVRLEYDSGVEVTLEGPADFELIDEAKAELKSGVLTASVPPGAEGFTVDTPTAEVVDLGTSFGIDLREDGVSNVSVFDGEVEIAVPDRAEKHLLTEGESVRIGSDYEIEKVGFDPQPFEKLWPIASGIVGSTDAFRFVPPWPKKIRYVESDNDIFIAVERRRVSLVEPLPVNISQPGEYARVHQLTPMELAPGDRVRSFMLHYSPSTRVGPRRAIRISGSITFDRPVLGLIVRHKELLASSRRFTRRGVGEINPRRELRLTGGPDGDVVSLSEDRRTITLDLISPGRSSDLVRVIVDAAPIRTSESN